MTETIYRAIRHDIVHCLLEPGIVVSETEMAERYGVGRTAARFALQRLADEEWVEPLPRKGYRVTPMTLESIDQLSAERMILEPFAARLAATRITAEQLERLKHIAERNAALDPAEMSTYFALNNDFHLLVTESAGSKRLTRAIADLLQATERVVYVSYLLRNPNTIGNQAGHLEIVEALTARDEAWAEDAMRRDVELNRSGIISALIESPLVRRLNLTPSLTLTENGAPR
jgi:DNA-binding GntR family transcriptional regulator